MVQIFPDALKETLPKVWSPKRIVAVAMIDILVPIITIPVIPATIVALVRRRVGRVEIPQEAFLAVLKVSGDSE